MKTKKQLEKTVKDDTRGRSKASVTESRDIMSFAPSMSPEERSKRVRALRTEASELFYPFIILGFDEYGNPWSSRSGVTQMHGMALGDFLQRESGELRRSIDARYYDRESVEDISEDDDEDDNLDTED